MVAMDWLLKVDWGETSAPGTAVLEIMLWRRLVYLTLFVLLRVVLKRQAGALGISEVLVVVLVADARVFRSCARPVGGVEPGGRISVIKAGDGQQRTGRQEQRAF
jgi:hypothetical protein